MHGLFYVTLFSTNLLKNENHNSVSKLCVSIDYAQDNRTSNSVSKLYTGNDNFVPLDNNENKKINKQTNKNKAKLKFYERIKVFLSKKCENTSSSYHPMGTGRLMDV